MTDDGTSGRPIACIVRGLTGGGTPANLLRASGPLTSAIHALILAPFWCGQSFRPVVPASRSGCGEHQESIKRGREHQERSVLWSVRSSRSDGGRRHGLRHEAGAGGRGAELLKRGGWPGPVVEGARSAGRGAACEERAPATTGHGGVRSATIGA